MPQIAPVVTGVALHRDQAYPASVGHAHHFLSRLDRVSLPHVELALGLYNDVPLLQYILGSVRLPDGAERVAISLADPERGPFLVVTREGRFVTCLGEGMSAGALPVVARARLDALATKAGVLRTRIEGAKRMAGPMGGVGKLLRRIHDAGDGLSREEIVAVMGLQPLYAWELFRFMFATGQDLMEARGALLAELKRTDKLRPRFNPTLRAYWNAFWSLGHLAVLSALDGPAMMERMPPALVSGLERASTSWTAVRQGVSSLALKAIWAVGRIGKPLLAPTKQRYRHAGSPLNIIDAGMGLSAIGIRHAKLHAEVAKTLATGPEVDRNETLGRLVHKINGVLRAVVDPEGASPSDMLPLHQAVGAKAWMVFTRRLPPGAPYRFEREEDVPEEIALPTAVNVPFDFLTQGETMTPMFLMLPWVARAAPEQLYLPRAVLAACTEPWTPERTLELLRSQRDYYKRAPAKPQGPARKGPCPCGSGKKYKRCCGVDEGDDDEA